MVRMIPFNPYQTIIYGGGDPKPQICLHQLISPNIIFPILEIKQIKLPFCSLHQSTNNLGNKVYLVWQSLRYRYPNYELSVSPQFFKLVENSLFLLTFFRAQKNTTSNPPNNSHIQMPECTLMRPISRLDQPINLIIVYLQSLIILEISFPMIKKINFAGKLENKQTSTTKKNCEIVYYNKCYPLVVIKRRSVGSLVTLADRNDCFFNQGSIFTDKVYR